MCERHAVTRTVAVAVVATLVLVSVTAPLAAAASETTVSIASDDGRVAVGETTTVQVVVDNANGGVGAAEFRVAVDDASVARITDVTVLGSGDSVQDAAADGSWVDVRYAFRDTTDTDSVTVAEVTIEVLDTGTTSIALDPVAGNDAVAVFDEAGTGYVVTGTDGTELSVSSDASSDSDHDDRDDTNDRNGGDDDGEAPSDTGRQTDGAGDDDSVPRTPSPNTNDVTESGETAVTETTDGVPTESTASTPGFTLALALLSLVAAGLLAGRR